mgnify:CR=1 FL=1
MKKILLAALILISSGATVYSQSLLSIITNKVERNLSSSLQERYKGNVNITDALETGSYIIVTGSFDYQIQTWIGPGNTVSRPFKAKVKAVLDEVQVVKLCYLLIVYGPHDPIRQCKCTNGSFESSNGELYVR